MMVPINSKTDCGYILKSEAIGFAKETRAGLRGSKIGVKDDCKIFHLSNQKEGVAIYWVELEQVEHICEERKCFQYAKQKRSKWYQEKVTSEEKEMQEHGLPRIQNKVCRGGQTDNCQMQEHFCSIDVEKCLTRLDLKDKWKRELGR